MFRCFSLLCVFSALVACAVVEPSSIIAPASSVSTMAVPVLSANDGTIFNSGSFRPMFEDYRARAVGDILTISILEKTSADRNNTTTASKSGSVNSGVGSLLSVPAATLEMLGVTGNSAIKSDAKAADGSSYNFSSTLSVTVTEVLPNRYLKVRGEKQIGLDKGTEFIRFSGLVAPESIGPGNVVSSLQVADARIEYRTASQVDKAELAKMLNRFFFAMSLL